MNTIPDRALPSVFVILGVTGDLAAKKIIPSLWHLFLHELLPERLSIIGFARRPFSLVEFEALIRNSVTKHGKLEIDDTDFSRFVALFSYHQGTFDNEVAFHGLAKRLDEMKHQWNASINILFYLSTPPSSYASIFKNLAVAGLNLPDADSSAWTRLLIEKPFGTNLASAKELQSLLSSTFTEEQIYRIDHYLFKEIIQGIEHFRFSNNLFEHTWDNTTIERIDFRLLESIGVENRGNFYDAVGTLRDTGQNHLLAMLSAIVMEYSLNGDARTAQQNRATALESLTPWTEKTLREQTFRAQYQGYQDIPDVVSHSQTETYFALKTTLMHSRWKGIPLFMEAGKCMKENRKEIVLTFKHPPQCSLCDIGPHEPNRIVFRLEPNDEILIHFWMKKPGLERAIEERTFSFFLYEKETNTKYVEEYAKILHSAMHGDQTFFISSREVEASWRFVDPLEDAWKQNVTPLSSYEPNATPTPPFFIPRPRYSEEQKKHDRTIGIIGLGKMGANIAQRLYARQWNVVGFDVAPDATKKLEIEGMRSASSLRELVDALPTPRTLWLMVPHDAVDDILKELIPILEQGDTVIDGGNAPYKESIRRGKELALHGMNFLDVGVSGGPEGARHGVCIMVGGEKALYEKYAPLFQDMSVRDGYGYMGTSGAGHFVKMVHNGIEYGMMQALGEGFELMKHSPFSLNLHSIADIYNHDSVITSRLVGWLVQAYATFGDDLTSDEYCSPTVSHSGAGQWTVDTAHELNIPVAIIEGALAFRKQSQEHPSYTGKVVSALRYEFGGHVRGDRK